MSDLTVRRSVPMGWYWKCLCGHGEVTQDTTRAGWGKAMAAGLHHRQSSCGLRGIMMGFGR